MLLLCEKIIFTNNDNGFVMFSMINETKEDSSVSNANLISFIEMSNSPRVWSKFSSTNSSGAVFNFRIVDLPKDRYGDFLEQYMNCFAKEESTYRASGIPKSTEAMEELRQAILKRRDDEVTHTVICCLDNENDEIQDIIGASIMMLGTPEEVEQKQLQLKPRTEAYKKMCEVYGGMLSSYDSIKKFNVERHFIDRGLFVHPGYRGLGIAQMLFKVRKMICKEYGVAIHGAWMTSYGTQKAAERDGWETVCEIQYDEYGKKYGVTFENGPPSCKFMVTRIPLL